MKDISELKDISEMILEKGDNGAQFTKLIQSCEAEEEDTVHSEELLQADVMTNLALKLKANTLHKEAFNIKLEGYENDAVPHPKLHRTVRKTMPQDVTNVFMDQSTPLSTMLGHPVGQVSCKDVQDSLASGKDVPVDMFDISLSKQGKFGKKREMTAQLLQNDDANNSEMHTVLVRGYRHPKKKVKDMTFPDIDQVPPHLRGVTLNPMADIVLEMTPTQAPGSASAEASHCKWYLRHMREGVHALASVLETEGRKHLKPILHKAKQQIRDAVEAHIKEKRGRTTQRPMSKEQADAAVHKVFQRANKKLSEDHRKKVSSFNTLMQGKVASGGTNMNDYIDMGSAAGCINGSPNDARRGPTQQMVNYAYKQAQQELLGRTDLCPANAGFAIDQPHERQGEEVDGGQQDVHATDANPVGLEGGSEVPYMRRECADWCNPECVGNSCCGLHQVKHKKHTWHTWQHLAPDGMHMYPHGQHTKLEELYARVLLCITMSASSVF